MAIRVAWLKRASEQLLVSPSWRIINEMASGGGLSRQIVDQHRLVGIGSGRSARREEG